MSKQIQIVKPVKRPDPAVPPPVRKDIARKWWPGNE